MLRDPRRLVKRRLLGAGVRTVHERQSSQEYQRYTDHAKSVSSRAVLQEYIAECKVSGAVENRVGQSAVYALGPAGLPRT